MNNIILESQIQDILIDLVDMYVSNDDIATSDLQGIAQAKARDIIELIKKASK
jgi:hypothetical protein